MTVQLSRLEAAKLDLGRMSLSTAQPLTIVVEGDGPGALRLAGPWAGAVSITRDGEPIAAVAPVDGILTLADDFTGIREYVLTP